MTPAQKKKWAYARGLIHMKILKLRAPYIGGVSVRWKRLRSLGTKHTMPIKYIRRQVAILRANSSPSHLHVTKHDAILLPKKSPEAHFQRHADAR